MIAANADRYIQRRCPNPNGLICNHRTAKKKMPITKIQMNTLAHVRVVDRRSKWRDERIVGRLYRYIEPIKPNTNTIRYAVASGPNVSSEPGTVVK